MTAISSAKQPLLPEYQDANKPFAGQNLPTETLRFPEGTYTGQVCNGQPHGFGTFSYHNGNKYVGDFVFGKKNGHGELTMMNSIFPGGNTYVGGFKDDLPDGKGVMKTARIDWKRRTEVTILRGQFKAGKIWEGSKVIQGGAPINACCDKQYKNGEEFCSCCCSVM